MNQSTRVLQFLDNRVKIELVWVSRRDAAHVAAKGFQPFDGFGIPPENGEAASIDVRSIFGSLLRHWKLVSIVPLLALIGTYIILMFVPQQFKSITEIPIANPKLQNEAGQPPSVF